VDFEPEAVTGAVRQAGKGIVRPKAVADQNAACRIVETAAGCTGTSRFEDGLLRFTLDGSVAALNLARPELRQKRAERGWR
jgi:hypothetical protein